MPDSVSRIVVRIALVLPLAAGALNAVTGAQDRLRSMPGYEQYQKVGSEIPGIVQGGALTVAWKDAASFEYARAGKLYRYDVTSRTAQEIGAAPPAQGRGRGRGGQGGPERGRQFDSALAPNRMRKAFHRDRNLWVSDPEGKQEVQVTTDGSAAARIKYGTASWVYGEELNQNTAMWWSPDSRKVAYYRFDEAQVPDYYLQLDQTEIQSRVDV